MLHTLALLLAISTPPADVVDELLRVRLQLEPPHSMSTQPPPAPEGSLDALAGYWAARNGMPGIEPPQADVAQKLTAVIEQLPRRVPEVVAFFPPTDEVCGQLAAWSERYGSEIVKEWRIMHCADERAELVALASAVELKDGFLIGVEALDALAASDGDDVAALLDFYIASAPPTLAAHAMALRYQHATGDEAARLRCSLQAIAADRSNTGGARDAAIEALSKSDWPGRDEWLASLFADPTLLGMSEGSMGYAPLKRVAWTSPDRWIPILVRLLNSSDRAVHSNAASALASFQLEDARADALRPLLPWLSDPQWADGTWDDRLRLTQSVAKVGLKEAAPQLTKELGEKGMGQWAADALAELGARVDRAPILDAMRAEKDPYGLSQFAHAFVVCAQPSAGELAAAAEAWATAGDRDAAAIGEYVVEKLNDRDDVAASILQRLPELEKRNAVAAANLRKRIAVWTVPSVDRANVADIAAGRVDARTIVTVLRARERVAANARRELAAIDRGVARGIAAAVGGDRIEESNVLRGSDPEAARGLLAATRITRDPLPAGDVAALFGRAPALDRAAEAWLVAEDSPAAREIIMRRYEGRIVILHPEMGAVTTGDEIDEFRDSGDDEWFFLDSLGAFAPEHKIVIAIRGDRTSIVVDGIAHALPPKVVDEFRALVTDTKFDDFPSLETGIADGVQSGYFHLRRRGYSRCVLMNNAWAAGGMAYDRVVRRFNEIAASVR